MITPICRISLLLACGACASTPARAPSYLVDTSTALEDASAVLPALTQEMRVPSVPGPAPRRAPGLAWADGQALMQGFLGVSEFSKVDVGDGNIDGDDGDLDELPVIGGGGQFKLGGERIDLGLEGIFGLSGRADAAAFVVGGGGAAVAVDVDLLILEIYGGPFASMFLGEKLRVYGAAGPLMQWADYDQSGNGLADDGSGFGFGWYGRTGVEFALPSRLLLGLGVRWSDTSVDLGGSLGDLEIDGLQLLFTVTRGL